MNPICKVLGHKEDRRSIAFTLASLGPDWKVTVRCIRCGAATRKVG